MIRNIKRAVSVGMVAGVVGLLGSAIAEPLVKMEGGAAKPGVVTAWSGSGTQVELTVKDGADAAAVAKAIEKGVEKVKAKVKAGKVVVTGKSQDDLLKALGGVDFGGEEDLERRALRDLRVKRAGCARADRYVVAGLGLECRPDRLGGVGEIGGDGQRDGLRPRPDGSGDKERHGKRKQGEATEAHGGSDMFHPG